MATKKSAPTIPTKKTAKKITPKAPQIDPKLISSVQAMRALATCYNLFSEGMFKHEAHGAVQASKNFIRTLHDQVTAEVLSHPESNKVDEIRAMRDQKAAKLKELKALESEFEKEEKRG